MKNNFIFYKKWSDIISNLPDNIRLEVYDAIINYIFNNSINELSNISNLAFNFIKNDIDNDNINKKEIYKKEKFDFKKILIEQYGCEKQHVDDWGEVRKEKKAAVTKTVLKKIINECENNKFPVKEAIKICAERSWQGFNYDWVKNIRVEEKSREQRINEMKNRIL